MITKLLNRFKVFYYKFRYIDSACKGLRIEGFPQFRGNPRIILGENVSIGPYTRFRGPGEIIIADNVHLSSGVIIDSKKKVSIGKYTLVGEYSTIADSDHDYKLNQLERHHNFVTRPVYIGENVWVGGRCAVLKGVEIGNNVVVGANTVVTDNIPDNSLVTGVKGRIVKNL